MLADRQSSGVARQPRNSAPISRSRSPPSSRKIGSSWQSRSSWMRSLRRVIGKWHYRRPPAPGQAQPASAITGVGVSARDFHATQLEPSLPERPPRVRPWASRQTAPRPATGRRHAASSPPAPPAMPHRSPASGARQPRRASRSAAMTRDQRRVAPHRASRLPRQALQCVLSAAAEQIDRTNADRAGNTAEGMAGAQDWDGRAERACCSPSSTARCVLASVKIKCHIPSAKDAASPMSDAVVIDLGRLGRRATSGAASGTGSSAGPTIWFDDRCCGGRRDSCRADLLGSRRWRGRRLVAHQPHAGGMQFDRRRRRRVGRRFALETPDPVGRTRAPT